MAPRIAKKMETIFSLIVLIIFCFVINKYYGESIHTEVSKYLDKLKVDKVYSDYGNLAKNITVVEKNSGYENFVPVLVYHGVVSGEPKSNEEIPLEKFEQHMFELKKNGYQTITMNDFYEFINNRKNIPDKSFVLTFDDGRKDSYYPVDPILKALGFKASMFVITNTFSPAKPSPYYLNVEELKKMIASGRWDIQSHGRDNHGFIPIDENGNTGRFMVNKKWLADEQRIETDEEYRDRILGDLVNSKNDLKEFLGINATAYALPAGDYGYKDNNYSNVEQEIQKAIEEVYPMTFYQFNINPDWRFGYYRENHAQNDTEQYFFKRIKIFGYFDPKRLLGILDAGHEKNIPYEDNFSNQDNWIVGWGEVNFNNNTLTFKNGYNNNNAAIFMDGALFWKNYIFNAKTNLVSGNYYGLLARVKNGKDFVACTFGNKKIRAFTMENGVSNPLGEKEILNFDATKQNNVGIEVRDNVLKCLVDGKVVLSETMSSNHENGGIGFMVYSEDKDIPAISSIAELISVSD